MYEFSVMAVMVLAAIAPRDATLRVHDFANLLSPAQRESLETLSQSVERQTTAELAIVTVPTLDGQSIDSYAHELFNQWGIGKKGLNNGVLLLVAPQERRMRIEVGYGGAINRREIAQKPYDEESSAYQQFLASWQGAVARRFSSQARSDWKAD
jgi:uncharacterized membrane protein YgcG